MLVRFQLHAPCVDRSMVEQWLHRHRKRYPVLLCPAGQIWQSRFSQKEECSRFDSEAGYQVTVGIVEPGSMG